MKRKTTTEVDFIWKQIALIRAMKAGMLCDRCGAMLMMVVAHGEVWGVCPDCGWLP